MRHTHIHFQEAVIQMTKRAAYRYALLIRLYELLRSKFKVPTGRSVIKIGGHIVKMYNDANERAYECGVLSEVALSNPITFKVLKVFKLLKIRARSALIMEYLHRRVRFWLLTHNIRAEGSELACQTRARTTRTWSCTSPEPSVQILLL